LEKTVRIEVMKRIRLVILSIAVVAMAIAFQNCDNKDEPSDQEVAQNLLMSKTWTVSSVSVPAGTATLDAEWANFNVKFNAGDMVTNGHPTGAEVVWPSTTYTLNTAGTSITRGDGVSMTITTLTENSLSVNFQMPVGTEISRVAALDGDYTFNLQ
jgi:hypothetical protein